MGRKWYNYSGYAIFSSNFFYNLTLLVKGFHVTGFCATFVPISLIKSNSGVWSITAF
jgi:hypothetical protein